MERFWSKAFVCGSYRPVTAEVAGLSPVAPARSAWRACTNRYLLVEAPNVKSAPFLGNGPLAPRKPASQFGTDL
jgi:hypothetical protein